MPQMSFTSGEVSPQIAARMDVAKYGSALKLARNVIVLREGGVRNRPGFQFVGQVRNSVDPVRLIPFQFDADEGRCLEFAWGKFRVIKDGAYVTRPAVDIEGIDTSGGQFVVQVTAHGWSMNQHIFLSGVVGLADGEGLSAVNGRTFRVDPDLAYTLPADTARLVQLDGHPIETVGLTPYVASDADKAQAIYELTTPYPADDLAELRYEQSADVMYLAHPRYPLQRLARHADDDWSIEAVTFKSRVNPPQNVEAAAVTGPGAAVPSVQTYRVSSFNDDIGQESLLSDSDQTTSNDLSLVGSYNTISWIAPELDPNWDPPTRYIVYKASNGLYGYIGSTTAPPVSDPPPSTPVPITFKDDNIDPDLGSGPMINADPLSGTGNFAGALGFYEQRLFLGGTDVKPNGVWGSRSADFQNMNYSRPLHADDALSFGISSRQVNRVLHLVPMSDLLAFTSESVFKIDGVGGDPIAPASISVKPQVHRGASHARPLVIDEAVLYVTAKGARLRNLGYQFASDAWLGADLTVMASHLFAGRTIRETAWVEYPHSAVFCVADDGSLLCLTWMPEQEVSGWSRLQTDGEIESICAVTEGGHDSLYAVIQRPRGNGLWRYVERLALPYEREAARKPAICDADPAAAQAQGICCCMSPTGIEHAAYLDSAVSYCGDPADRFSGLEHLEGRTVSALADGDVVHGLVVANGAVSLPAEARVVTVGIPYVATIQTLPVVMQNGAGKRQGASRAVVRLLDSRGMTVGVDPDRLQAPKPRLDAGWNEPSDLISGDCEVVFDAQWSSDLGVIVQQAEPLPMTVLGVYPDIQAGG